MRRNGQSQWNSVAGNRGCSGRLRWFRGSVGFASPLTNSNPNWGGVWTLFGCLFFFFSISKRGDDAGSNKQCSVSRLLPSPATLEPNRSIWDVGNKNLTDNVAPLSTMDGFPGLPAETRSPTLPSMLGDHVIWTRRHADSADSLRGRSLFFSFGAAALAEHPPQMQCRVPWHECETNTSPRPATRTILVGLASIPGRAENGP